MEKLFQTIQIGKEEEISSILSKISGRKLPALLLSVPRQSLLFHSPINFKILKEEAEKQGIALCIETSDKMGQVLAGKIGIKCFDPDLDGDSEKKEILSKLSRKKKPRIIILKKDLFARANTFSAVKGGEEERNKVSFWGYLKKRAVLTAALFFISAMFIFSNYYLPRANVFIFLRPDVREKEKEFFINPGARNFSGNKKEVPGKIVEITKTFSRDFPATGKRKVEKYARGDVMFFNEWDSHGQTFSAGSELVSESGKIFVASKDFIIPGFSRMGGEDIAGQVKISVAAKEPGPQYNVSSQKFFIASLNGTERFNKIYGKSASAMSGGEIGVENIVAREDIENAGKAAQAEMEKIFFEHGREDGEKTNGEIYVENFSFSKISDLTISAKEGEAAENFSIKANLTRKVCILNKEVFLDFLKKSVEEENQSGKINIPEDSLKIVFISNENNLIKALGKFALESETEANEEKIKRLFAGKDEKEIKKLLGSLDLADEFSVKFWPFWVRQAPKKEEKINVFLDRNNYFSIIN